MITLTTLGTGTVSPHAERTCAAHFVDVGPWDRGTGGPTGADTAGPAVDSTRSHGPTVPRSLGILLDCGPGTCHRLARSGIAWMELTHVAITHFHPDHYAELPALLFAMKYGAMAPRQAPLTLIGPAGFRARLERLAAAFGEWVLEPGWPLEVVELDARSGAATGDRRPTTEGRRARTVDRRPVPVAGSRSPVAELAPGVTLACHRTPHTEESLAYAISDGERRLVYTGDTGPSDDLADWARDCDLLLAECSLPDELALDLHLTPRQAGALAARAHAGRLVLTHFYPPVERVDIVAQVRESYGGPVELAVDGGVFRIP